MMSSRLAIIVTGLVAQYPLGGLAWHYVQYLFGLARLGHDVYYLEDTGKAPYNPRARGAVEDCRFNVEYLAGIMSQIGLPDKWAYRSPRSEWLGLSAVKRTAILKSADLLINVSGSLAHPQDYREVRKLAYIDTDPVFTQVKIAQGKTEFRERIDAHDVLFSFGERVNETSPRTGHDWRATRQPVVLSKWRPSTSRRDVFTTVMNWSAKDKPLIYGSQTYGQKHVEFARFLDLPSIVAPTVLEVALNTGKGSRAPRELLTSNGWRLVDPDEVCLDLDSYHRYIESSKAEWSAAKHGYVQGQSGWFSERSACYLAAGRPVVVQETGFSSVLPVGEGILPFSTIEEAAAGIREVERDYPRHANAARAIAEEYFNSDKVLDRLIDEALSSSKKSVASSAMTQPPLATELPS
jgi:hypothetical protein